MTTKTELLAHYARSEPKNFYQIDGFVGYEEDVAMRPDEQGYALTGQQTTELMSGLPTVRVLITGGAEHEDVIALLERALDWVKRDPTGAEFSSPRVNKADVNVGHELMLAALWAKDKQPKELRYEDSLPF